MTNIQNLSIAEDIETCMSEIHESHKQWLNNNTRYQAISHSLTKLINRSCEYRKPTFVVLVVGPVKAGKSTFVNLVANNYVSPTHFLECTIKPSIIHTGLGEKITIYRSNNTANEAEQMEDILDCINGLIEKESVNDINTTEVDLTEDNINRYVKGGIKNEDNVILTSITTKGGPLIQDNVFLVDMPGFDGSKAYFDNLYETIVKRADLLIFVQSSNSAISKVTSNFFDFIKTHNTSAPICLIHNVFEAAYWRSDDCKLKDIEYQKQYAIQAIQQKGLSILEDNAFNINLGMVSDKRNHRFDSYGERLDSEEEYFEKVEVKMHDLFKKRESIRILNCISRCNIQKSDLLAKIETAIEDLKNKLLEYTATADTFDQLKLNHWPFSHDEVSDVSINIDLGYLRGNIAEVEYNEIKAEVVNKKYRTDDARAIAKKFLDSVEAKLNKYLNDKISELKQLKNLDGIKKHITSITVEASHKNVHKSFELQAELPVYSLEFNPNIDIALIIPYLTLGYKHSNAEVLTQLEAIFEKLIGKHLAITHVHTEGYLSEVAKQMTAIISEAKEAFKNDIREKLNVIIDQLKDEALANVIPNIEEHAKEIANLEHLKDDLKKVTIYPYE